MGAIDAKAINIHMQVTGPYASQMVRNTAVTRTFGNTANVSMGKAQAGMARFGATASKVATGGAIAVAVGLALSAKAAIDFQSSFAGVRKTVDTTEIGFQRLSDGIRRLALEIPIGVNELNRIAELGGQLGVGADDLLTFTKTIALVGVTTTLATEQAATGFARLDNIMQLSGQSYDRIGAAIVHLGNNFAATEDEILNFALRIAPIGATVGLTTDEVLAIATAFTSVGVRAERGGTAIQKTFIAIAEAAQSGGMELAIFANVAGMTGDQFAKLAKQDPAAAFTAFVTGLDDVSDSGGNVFAVLDSVHLGNARVIQSLLAMSNAGDVLNEALEDGNDAWEDNIALTEEAQKRFDTVASKLILAKNRIADLAITIGTELLPVIADFALGLSTIIDWFVNLDPAIRNTTLAVAGLTTALLVAKAHPVILGLTLVAGAVLAIGANAAAAEARVKILKDALASGTTTKEDLGSLIGEDALKGLFGVGFKEADVRKAIFGTETDYRNFLEAVKQEARIINEDLQGVTGAEFDFRFDIAAEGGFDVGSLTKATQEVKKRRREVNEIRAEDARIQGKRNRARIFGIETQGSKEHDALVEAGRSSVKGLMRWRQGINAELDESTAALEAAFIDPKFIDNVDDALSEYVETVQDAFSEVEDSILGNLDAWFEFDDELDAAFDDIIKTLQRQVVAMAEFETLIASLDLRPDVEAKVREIYDAPALMEAFVGDFESGGAAFITALENIIDDANKVVFNKWIREQEKVEFVAGKQFLADIAAVADEILADENNIYNPAAVWLGLITQALDSKGPEVKKKILDVLLSAFGEEGELASSVDATKAQIDEIIAKLIELSGVYTVKIDFATSGDPDYLTRYIRDTPRRGGLQKAHGGFAYKNEPYVIGEAGRELFVPFNSGTIIPTKNLNSKEVTYNLNVYGSEDTGSDARTVLLTAQTIGAF